MSGEWEQLAEQGAECLQRALLMPHDFQLLQHHPRRSVRAQREVSGVEQTRAGATATGVK